MVIRRLIGRVDLPGTGYVAELRVEAPAAPARSTLKYGKIYLPGGPTEDPTPQWQGPFPPSGYVETKPALGAVATYLHGQQLSRARIIAMTTRSITVRIEYRNATPTFRLDKAGEWREVGNRDCRLVVGIEASNVKSFKVWYRPETYATDWQLD